MGKSLIGDNYATTLFTSTRNILSLINASGAAHVHDQAILGILDTYITAKLSAIQPNPCSRICPITKKERENLKG